MKNLKFASLAGVALALGSCAALSSLRTADAQSNPAKSNLVSLFLVKRNNLNQQYRGELYPIVEYSNGRYKDVSVDVTQDVRDKAKEADIVKANAAKSILKNNPAIAVLNPSNNKVGDFKVAQIGVVPLACTSSLVGRGNFTGSSNLQALFNQLPRDRDGGYRGPYLGKEIDESSRWTVATQTPSPFPSISFTQAQFNQYRKDLVRVGTAEIAKDPQAKAIKDAPILEEVRVFDLDRDGKPEVYGKLRKGPNPRTVSRRGTGKAVAIYSNVWLGYTAPQPKLLSAQVVPYYVPASDTGGVYEVIGPIDANVDGKSEVLIRNIGYEGVNFSIYELQNNQLKPVFTGAGYGC